MGIFLKVFLVEYLLTMCHAKIAGLIFNIKRAKYYKLLVYQLWMCLVETIDNRFKSILSGWDWNKENIFKKCKKTLPKITSSQRNV